MFAVLPHCVGSESVYEEEVGFGSVWGFWDPAMHRRCGCDGIGVGEIGGDGAETGVCE